MSRLLCCVLCLLVSPAAAEIITVEDGQSFERINLTTGRELVVNGGDVELVNNLGSLVTINGGAVGDITTNMFNDENGGHEPRVVVTGYSQAFGINTDGPSIGNLDNGHVVLHGYSFRVLVDPLPSKGSAVFGYGWLLDGSYVDFSATFKDVFNRRNGQSVTLVKHDPVFVDPTGDWEFDLTDLNVIRNNFGSSGEQSTGDTNFDGVVDLGDLNLVRNKFGLGYGDMPAEWEYSGDVPTNVRHRWTPDMPIPVPEPSTLLLMLLGFCALAGIPLRRRWCSFRRHQLPLRSP